MIYNIKNKIFYENKEISFVFISNIEELICLKQNKDFTNINNFVFDYNTLDNENIHFLYFINKNIYVNDVNLDDTKYKKIFMNPLISGIYNISDYLKLEYTKFNSEIKCQLDINNIICHININDILKFNVVSNNNLKDFIYEKIDNVFNYFLIYHIYNLPNNDNDDFYNEIFKYIIDNLGESLECHPVNDPQTLKSYSRDIKYEPNAIDLHFYSSNQRQPLHNDYAYYPPDKSPDWLLLYCLKPSEYGGITSLISNQKINDIIKKYNYKLYQKLKKNINYLYTDDKNINGIEVSKILFNTDTNVSNWNYFQLKDNLNDENTILLKNDFKNFLEEFITGAKISDIHKNWKRGDCVIFNDHLVMHERSSFHGNRHLKDLSFFSRKFKLYI